MRAATVLIGNLLRLVVSPLWLLWRWRAARKGPWVRLRLRRRLSPAVAAESRLQRFVRRNRPWSAGGGEATSLSDFADLARALAADESTTGLLLLMPRLETGWAACQGLRTIISELVAADRQVVVYLAEGAGQLEMFVASAASRIVIAPTAQVQLLGLSSQTAYLGGLLEGLGLRAEVQAVGDYKTAGERFERTSMSEPQREQVTALLSAIQDCLTAALAQRPGLDADSASALFERGLWHAQDALQAGLVDDTAYEDGLPALLGAGEVEDFRDAAPYLSHQRARLWRPVLRQPYICVVPIQGTIAMQPSPLGAGAALEPTLARLRAAASDKRAVGVILHVDSPGGSALASDLIHHEVERLAEKKPVVAHFGEVAASGGYYVAAAAQRIVAQPQTVTGSIGVISGKLIAGALLERQGVRMETVTTAPHADMFSVSRAWSDAERALLSTELGAIYRDFLQVVARGRGRALEEVEAWAGGRVWSGRDALPLGLVDVLGGFDVALEELRKLLKGQSPEALARLRPVWPAPPRGPLRPPEAAPRAMAGEVWADLAGLEHMLRSQERVYCYAPDLPRIR